MRDQRLFPFFADLESLPGIGPKSRSPLEKLLGGHLVLDLLLHLPERWLDRRVRDSLDQTEYGEVATVRATVEAHEIPRHEKHPHRVRMVDHTGFLTLVFFRANSAWLKGQLPVGSERVVSGRIEDWQGQRQMTHPDHIADPARPQDMPPVVEPIYRLTAGLTNQRLHRFMLAALETLPDALPEWTDAGLLARRNWPSLTKALRALHAPQKYTPDLFELARQRLAHDEALAREILFLRVKATRELRRAPQLLGKPERRRALIAALPFTPTGAQLRCADEIGRDLAAPYPMRRMVQGDVGSGKTLVAAFAALDAADSRHQVAVMAPTEVLARQQFATLRGFLAPLGVSVAALTGRDRGTARESVLLGLADGSLDVVVGTHALFQDKVSFRRLGLIVVDEQHRFGVSDRARLSDKGLSATGQTPHTLVMSATPIPRTLAMAVHGDVDMSLLDEKPAGRQPVRTAAKPDTAIEEVIEAVSRAVKRGERAFWICPKVDVDEDESSAVHRHAVLAARLHVPVALVHGRMKPEEKDAALDAFRDGRAGVLVATTVVEVGVDVPEATIMVIERAESFGLAQLHQLRGRVGRGDRASACLLLYRAPLTETGEKRIATLRATEDGFEIAEADFRLRGPGDILGLRQSGLPDFRVINLPRDADILAAAHDGARLVAARGHLRDEGVDLLVSLLGPGSLSGEVEASGK